MHKLPPHLPRRMQTAAVVLQNVSVPPGVRGLLEQLTSTEARLVVTVGTVAVALVAALVVAPMLIRRLRAAVRHYVPAGRVSRAIDRTGRVVPTSPAGLVLRAIQAGVLFSAAVSLLVVWGLAGLAVEVITFLGFSLPFLGQITTTVALALVAYVAADVLRESAERFATRSDRVTEHQQEIVLRAGNLGLLALFVTATLTVWGIDLSGLLVGAGFLGIVVGLAARQTLGSLIAGFVLMFSRPFTIGDWVEVGDNEGVVTDITIVNTRLENFDGETVVIPNDSVANQPITNRSERGHLRIRLEVGIDYDTDPEHAAEIARERMEELKPVTDSPPPQVIRQSFGDSAVVLELRFWIDRPMPPRKWRAVDAVVQSVKDGFEREGIKIPFPQRELSGRAETGGFRIAEEAVDRSGAVEDRGVRPEGDG
jgi:small-conductance mechanosensitive channel